MEDCLIKDPAEQFANWADGLKRYERVFFFNKIALACDISYQAVFKWSIRKTKLKKPYIDIINSVVGHNVIRICNDSEGNNSEN